MQCVEFCITSVGHGHGARFEVQTCMDGVSLVSVFWLPHLSRLNEKCHSVDTLPASTNGCQTVNEHLCSHIKPELDLAALLQL